jgi:hypothetical protein
MEKGFASYIERTLMRVVINKRKRKRKRKRPIPWTISSLLLPGFKSLTGLGLASS